MNKKIPRYIDSPKQLFFWEIDELIPLFASISLGIVMNFLTYSIIAGLILTKVVKKLKEGKIDGLMLHYLYWIGIIKFKTKRVRNTFEKILVE